MIHRAESHNHRSPFVAEINSLMMCLFGTPAALLGNANGNGTGLDEDMEEGGERENDILPGWELLLYDEERHHQNSSI